MSVALMLILVFLKDSTFYLITLESRNSTRKDNCIFFHKICQGIIDIIFNKLQNNVTWKHFCVAMCSRKDAVFDVMFLEAMQSGVTDAIQIKKIFAYRNRLKLVNVSWASGLFFTSNLLAVSYYLNSCQNNKIKFTRD